MNKKKKLALCGIFLLGGGYVPISAPTYETDPLARDIGICIARTYYVSTLDIYNIDITCELNAWSFTFLTDHVCRAPI